MLTKIKQFVQIALLIIGLILAFSLTKNILKINGSGQKITDAQTKVNMLQKENQRLKNELNQIQTPQFVEGQARDKLGLAKKGETVVVLPDDESLKLLAPKLEESQEKLPESNWQKWLKLFL